MSFLRLTCAALAAALTVSFGSANAAAPLELTGSGTEASALIAFAKANACRVERSDEEGAVFGRCFGIPGEVGSKFELNGRGEVTSSEITLTDEAYAETLRSGLTLVHGQPRLLPNFGEGWTVGNELWALRRAKAGVLFIRAVRARDEEKEVGEMLMRVDALSLL